MPLHPHHVRVEIEFTAGAEPISGLMTTEAGGRPREFSGWMELVAALDTAVTGNGSKPSDDGASPPA